MEQLLQHIGAHAPPASIPDALSSAIVAGRLVPAPVAGRTWERWQCLAAVAAMDLTTPRVLEAHLDAVANLVGAGCGEPEPHSTWGVFAAEWPQARVQATGDDVRGWRFTGRKPWCSLADQLTHALVTAHVEGGRRLFAIALRQPGIDKVNGEYARSAGLRWPRR